MRKAGAPEWIAVMAAALSAWAAFAQSPGSTEAQRAEEQASRARTLVEAGALARAKLAEVEQEVADARDEDVLRRILYGNLAVEDLTEQQAEEVVQAANRRFGRQKARVEHAKKLVEEGALPRLSLTPLLEELDARRRTLDLANSRAALLRELAEMARLEEAALRAAEDPQMEFVPVAERYDGAGVLRAADVKTILQAFEKQFARPLPISARGGTAVHRALGFDHRGRIDVAIDPDQPEGVWLRTLLQALRVPYFAFRAPVPGRATGPHIHIGPPSERIARGG